MIWAEQHQINDSIGLVRDMLHSEEDKQNINYLTGIVGVPKMLGDQPSSGREYIPLARRRKKSILLSMLIGRHHYLLQQTTRLLVKKRNTREGCLEKGLA